MSFACLPKAAVLSLAILAASPTVSGASMYPLPPQDGASPEQSYVTANVNLRGGPGTNYPALGRLVPGDFVDIITCGRTWCHVQAPARGDGWIARRYIREGVTVDPGTDPRGPREAPRTVPYGNDALPSAEMSAFQELDARLAYPDARIEYDDGGCALYVATDPDGRTYSERLRNPDNTTICRP